MCVCVFENKNINFAFIKYFIALCTGCLEQTVRMINRCDVVLLLKYSKNHDMNRMNLF